MENNNLPLCHTCHQPLKIEYYFCPNCGAKTQETPLPTTPSEQIKLYIYSAVLPWIGFFTIGKWTGLKYLKSKDQKTKQIGIIACIIMAVSLILLCYVGYIEYQAAVQSINSSISSDFGL
jgi:hypothetical protein